MGRGESGILRVYYVLCVYMGPLRDGADEAELEGFRNDMDSLADCETAAEFWGTVTWLKEFVPGLETIMFEYEGWETVAMAELIVTQALEQMLLCVEGTEEYEQVWELIYGDGVDYEEKRVGLWDRWNSMLGGERTRRRDDEDRYDPRSGGYGGA